jgi:hypothetical protein
MEAQISAIGMPTLSVLIGILLNNRQFDGVQRLFDGV